MQRLYENLFYSKPVNELFEDESFIKHMLRFEAALAKAQAEQGLIPDAAAKLIGTCCRIENIRIELLIEQIALGGNVNIPFIKQLTQAVAIKDVEAAKYIHFGATSQDVMDTATVLQLRDALTMMANDLDLLIKQLIGIMNAHRNTMMIGRSFKQHARPITFGFKVAKWLDALLRSRKHIAGLLQNNLVLQLGGAVGTLSSMEDKGLKIAEAVGKILDLKVPAIPWHSQRDRFAEIATTLGILQGNIGKLAEDVNLLMQTEISEVSEPSLAGKGGSSSMPHKRNPVGCIAISANSKRMPALVSTMLNGLNGDHERATGHWHAEWETLATIVKLAAGSARQAVVITNGLEVDTNQMRINLELTKGLIYAENISLTLTKHIGKSKAEELVEKSCREAKQQGIHLKELIKKNPEVMKYLSPDNIEELFDPKNSIGLCNDFINRVLNLV